MPFNSSINLPTGTAVAGTFFTRDLDADGFIDELPFVQPALVSLPDARFMIGDSQVLGAASGIATSSVTAFQALWAELFAGTPTYTALGGSGRELQGHIAALQANWGVSGTPRPGPDWVHIMETGNQNMDGQRTPAEYGATWVAGVQWIVSRSPNAVMSAEIPTSFGRIGEIWRDWRAYGEELRRRVAALATQGITVHLIETDSRIRALEKKLTPAVVWYPPPDGRQYHFTEVGNLMVAMTMLWHLGYNTNALTFTSILAEGTITQAQIDACNDVLAGV